jgi:signal transduction histidine kinase
MSRKPEAPRPRAPRASVRHGLRRRPHDATLARLRRERDLALDRARREAEFISHASHEIRTPLHGIMGFSTLLLSTELTDEQRSFANALHTSIESLLAVVNDVLDVSTLDAGAMRLESVRFNLLTLVRGLVDTFGQAAAAKGLALRVDTTAVKHPHLVGDPGRVRQVLANFVSNAVKFTDAGEVMVRAVTRATGAGTAEVEVSVTDTGRGIPRHAQARLFQPFSRLQQPRRRSRHRPRSLDFQATRRADGRGGQRQEQPGPWVDVSVHRVPSGRHRSERPSRSGTGHRRQAACVCGR